MTDQLFCSLDSKQISREISHAQTYACYAAPGILDCPDKAFVKLARCLGTDKIVVCLDFNEHVMRMGYGTYSAVETLRNSQIEIRTISGLRTGLLIVDNTGFIFTPTPLYLEAENQSSNAPNALRLAKTQIQEALARLSLRAKQFARESTSSRDKSEQIEQSPIEVYSKEVELREFQRVKRQLDEAPPVEFDLARQVRVYNSYLQYVEIKLTGVAIQRRRLALPAHMLGLTENDELAQRLKTTFDLIEKNDKFSSKNLEDELNHIRKNFTQQLNEGYGRVVLKSAKPILEERLNTFRSKLKGHQEQVRNHLQELLDRSRNQIIEHVLPNILKSPPDHLIGRYGAANQTSAQLWLEHEVNKLFPSVDSIADRMQLDVRYKDLTFETLQNEDFLNAVKTAFPGTDWGAAHDEYRAAGEKRG